MKNFVVSLAGLSVLLSLTACGTEVKTQEYYSKHLDEAKARNKECEKQESLSKDQEEDCANARWAVEMAPDDRVPYGIGKDEKHNDTDALRWK